MVHIRTEEEPDSMSKKEVYLTCFAQNISDVLLFLFIKLIGEVETAKLRNEKLKIRPDMYSLREIWI